MRLMQIIVCIGACSLLLSSSCSETSGPDPCSGARPVTARFTVHEVLYNKTAPSADTVLKGNMIIFAADERYDSYEWHIGYDNRVWRDSAVSLRFEEAVGNIPVTLIAKRTPQVSCFPNDDGIDTLMRMVNVIGGWDSTRVLGRYHGYNTDNPKDTFTFSLEYKEVGEFGKRFVLNNLNQGCKEPPDGGTPEINIRIGYRAFQFDAGNWIGNGCDEPRGTSVLYGDGDSIVVQYQLVNRQDLSKYIAKTFVGRRLQ